MYKQFVVALLGASAVAAQSAADKIVTDLNNISGLVEKLTTALNNYDGTIPGGVPILTQSKSIESSVESAVSDAQAAGSVSEADQAKVLEAANDLYPNIIDSLKAFVGQSDAFDSAGLGPTASSQLSDLQKASASLAGALVDKATGDIKTAAQELAKNIDDAFNTAANGQVPTARPVPDVPSTGGSSSGGDTTTAAPSSTAAAGGSDSSATSTPAVTSEAPTSAESTPTPTAEETAPTSSYTGAAAKVVSNVGGAVLLAAAAFAL